MTTTTVRIQRSTRDKLAKLSSEQGSSADTVIAAGLRALEREQLRRRAEEDVRRLAADPADRAEVAAAIRDLLGE